MNEQHPNEKVELIEGLGSETAQPQAEEPKPAVKKAEKKAGLQVKSRIQGGFRIFMEA